MRSMRKSYIISAIGHAFVLLWSVWSFTSRPLPTHALSEALPVGLITASDLTQITAGSKTAPPAQTAHAAERRRSALSSTSQELPAKAADESPRGPQIPPEYRGGLGESGLASLKSFAEAGGTIITLNKASEVYAGKDAGLVDNALD